MNAGLCDALDLLIYSSITFTTASSPMQPLTRICYRTKLKLLIPYMMMHLFGTTESVLAWGTGGVSHLQKGNRYRKDMQNICTHTYPVSQ